MELRPYQQECVDAVMGTLSKVDSCLITIPTGGGKTIIFSKLIEKARRNVLVLAHREELLNQAKDKLKQATGLDAMIEKGKKRASTDSKVVIASVQTMVRRLGLWSPDHFSLIIVDEAHHARSKTYERILAHFNAKRLGVTATPDRGDKKVLSKIFETVAYDIPIDRLIREGYLCPIKAQICPLQIDVRNLRSRAGDFSLDEAGELIDPYLQHIAKAMRVRLGHRKTIVFLPLIHTSQKLTKLLNESGLSAKHIDGKSKDREEILQQFHRGEFQILCNSMLLTEGFDEPSVSAVVVLRPTKVRALYCQMVGRGTRVAPDKEDLLILDFLWLTGKHDLVRPQNLLTDDPEVSEHYELGDKEKDLMDAQKDAVSEREKALAKKLQEESKRREKLIDPIDFAIRIGVEEPEEDNTWNYLPATEKQKQALAKFGINPNKIKRGKATRMLSELFARKERGLASPKQVKLLERCGYPNPQEATRGQAGYFIGGRFKR